MKFNNILIPFDTSEHALHALTLAKGMAEEDPNICLHIVSVIYVSEVPPSLGLDGNPYETVPPLAINPDFYQNLVSGSLEREKADMKASLGDMLDSLPNPLHIHSINAPSTVDGITDYARKNNCNLIVMGSRGLGLLRGMLGSVSYGVLRSSEIPVLIAKQAEEA